MQVLHESSVPVCKTPCMLSHAGGAETSFKRDGASCYECSIGTATKSVAGSIAQARWGFLPVGYSNTWRNKHFDNRRAVIFCSEILSNKLFIKLMSIYCNIWLC
jgi:hypothetical protein